jgi:competence protein ComEC
LESPGLNHLLAEEPWRCDVLLAPHHGSRGSDPPGLADWCRPRWVVVSGGRRYDIRATRNAYSEAGSQILHTAELGSIRFRLEGDAVDLATFHETPLLAEGRGVSSDDE